MYNVVVMQFSCAYKATLRVAHKDKRGVTYEAKQSKHKQANE